MSRTAIVKPTHACNLACKYCYVGECKDDSVMDSETLENTVKKTIELSSDRRAQFIWHGGEPLMAGKGFFEHVADLTRFYKEKGYNIGNSVQTNGTLLDDEMADFFSDHDHIFGVGLSLDGPREVHDSVRYYKDGKGSFDDVMAAVDRLRERDRNVGVISVINKKNFDRMAEIYEFFKWNDMDFKANPLIFAGYGKTYYDELAIKPDEYADAMISLFDMWFDDPNPNMRMTVDNFDSLVRTGITNDTYSCNFSSNCQVSFMSVSVNGDVYPCGRFDETDGFRFGNVNEDSASELRKSDIRARLLEREENLGNCHGCEYVDICHGGCMHNAYMKTENVMTKDYYCPSYKKIFGHVFNRVNVELVLAAVEDDKYDGR